MADMSEKRIAVVEIPPAIVHPAVEPRPIAYVVSLSPGETPTNYNVSKGIRGDDLEVSSDLGLKTDASIEEIIKAAEHEERYSVPGSESGEDQDDYIVECWHRRDRLWVIYSNYRPTERPDSENTWDNYFNPHSEGGCNLPDDSCQSCLMAAVFSYTGLNYGMTSTESALEKIKSFADYWIWEHGQLEP